MAIVMGLSPSWPFSPFFRGAPAPLALSTLVLLLVDVVGKLQLRTHEKGAISSCCEPPPPPNYVTAEGGAAVGTAATGTGTAATGKGKKNTGVVNGTPPAGAPPELECPASKYKTIAVAPAECAKLTSKPKGGNKVNPYVEVPLNCHAPNWDIAANLQPTIELVQKSPDFLSKYVTQSKLTTKEKIIEQLKRAETTAAAKWVSDITTIKGGKTPQGEIDKCSTRTLNGLLQAARKKGFKAVTIIWYDLPNRDCSADASNGEICCDGSTEGFKNMCAQELDSPSADTGKCEKGIKAYEEKYAKPLFEVLKAYSDLRLAVVVEPDSLPNTVTNMRKLKCSKETAAGYQKGIELTLGLLAKLDHVTTYLDAAHGGWLGFESNFGKFAKMMKDSLLGKIRGFAINTSNYQPIDSSTYGVMVKAKSVPAYKQTSQVTDNAWYAKMLWEKFEKPLLVDVGRSGNSCDGWAGDKTAMPENFKNWCNVARGALGPPPRATPATKVFKDPKKFYTVKEGELPELESLDAKAIDAWAWLKTPGEVDGCSHDKVPATSWWLTKEAAGFRKLVGGASWDPAKKFCNANVDAICNTEANDPEGIWPGSGKVVEVPDAGRFSPHNIISLATNAAILGIGTDDKTYTGCLRATNEGDFKLVT
eukprot:g16857.t1